MGGDRRALVHGLTALHGSDPCGRATGCLGRRRRIPARDGAARGGDSGAAAAELRTLNAKVVRLEAALISVAKSNSQLAMDMRALLSEFR